MQYYRDIPWAFTDRGPASALALAELRFQGAFVSVLEVMLRPSEDLGFG